ncbi:ROK family protein [Clostridium beijerinckii]|uniref:ROK family protein n=1 Tax=Clostridium beijerinckii TaxID=1520 RepID=UPI0015706BE5|nr:ROK family protein [Clostridium beijerinckii]NRT72822.1 glucokinase [Clostridium beijerinckii]
MKYFIGIDIGGTNLRAAILDNEYNLIDKFKIDNIVEKGAKCNIDNLINMITEKWNKYKVEAIGVACPGPLDIRNGVIINPPNLRGWEGFKIKKHFEEHFELPVIVNNDANLAGYCEARIGAAKNAESVYYITLSTGVGGGFIYKNQIVNGFNNIAGEVCNMIINEDKYRHAGLNSGGLEGQCSGVSISRIGSGKCGQEFSTKDIFDKASGGDVDCLDVLNEWTINLSKAIANIITTVDPEVIVLGGSVILNNSNYLEKLINEVKLRVFNNTNVNIKLAKIGDDAGLLGAGILASCLN